MHEAIGLLEGTGGSEGKRLAGSSGYGNRLFHGLRGSLFE
jgi:hypothetical protein